ncbi:Protein RTM1 [Penicillium frequentans]|uniref:Protein RTM1 n=1 Tax=Penicillium frequentans TaxID=3151616 RepID=A0AAD6CYN4_9EURO|nr:Protein RTM1 [Penicillium glabrum]
MSTTTSDGAIDFALYRYTPSIPAAAIFAGIFLLLSILHLVRLVRNRTYFFIPFIVGLLFECAGYIARIFSHFDAMALGPYIVQTMLILVAPPLFAASIYMMLGRVVVKLGAEKQSIVPVRFLTKTFVVGDVISFLMQCGGGGYMAAGSISAMNTGANIVVGGLVVQLLFFGFFVAVSTVFHWRFKRQPRYIHVSSTRSHGPETRMTWEAVMWALYIACLLILVRSVFRVVEFVEGNNGFIMRREYLLYLFDACLMSLTGLVLGIVYPGSFLPQGSKRDSELQLMSTEEASAHRDLMSKA